MDGGLWKSLRTVYERMVEAPARDPSAQLGHLKILDPSLSHRLELLASGHSFPDQSSSESGGPSPAPNTAPGSPVQVHDSLGLVGRTFSHFDVIAPLRAGGMGIVYHAEDIHLRRRVALKFPLPQYTLDPVAKERFLREARSAAALDHPNICAVHEVGEHDGQLFLAMPLYPGESVASRLENRGRIAASDALDIVRQVAAGLECAHQAGIVHRDLKPGNLMLLPDGTVKILDFGLAKGRDVSLTESHAMVGTLSYMAPEQIRGERVSAATDLWALGVVLYEMLTGERVFSRDNPYAVIYAILNDEPVKLDLLPTDLPEGAEAILARLLEKDATQRYSSASALLEVLGRRGEEAAIPSALENRVQLPTTATPFIGRTEEIQLIAARLRDPASRIVTVVGSGGVGKSRLSIEAARSVAPEFRDGVRFVPLAQLDPEERLDASIVQLLGMQPTGSEDSRAALARFLGAKSMLLVLDNFEHLSSQAAVISELVNAAPKVRVLVTSRERLGIYGETLVPLRGLTYPVADGAVAERDESVELFLSAARRVLPEFEPTAEESRAIARICRFVQGVPLAVELAAAWVGVLSCDDIAKELQQEKQEVLSNTLRDIPERHRSLRAVFEWSWRLLEESERQAFAQLAVFPAGFTRHAAEQVAAASLRDLSRLSEKSLIERRDSNRFEIIQVLRQYAYERLSESPALLAEVTERHALHYARILEENRDLLLYGPTPEPVNEVGLDIDNIRQAGRWLVQHRREAEIARSFEGLYNFYLVRGWAREGAEAFGLSVRELSEGAEASESRFLLCHRLAYCQAVFCSRLGLYSRAKELLTDALQAFREKASHRDVANALHQLAVIALNQGALGLVDEYGSESLRISLEIGDQPTAGRATIVLGTLAIAKGDYPAATAQLREGMRIYRSIGNQRGVAVALKNLGAVAFELGAYEEAQGYLRESLAIDRAWGDQLAIANCLQNLGCVTFRLGLLEESESYLNEGVAISREMGFRRIETFCKGELANLYKAQSRLAEAQKLYRESLSAAFETNEMPILLEIMVSYSTLLESSCENEMVCCVLETVFNHPSAQEDTRQKALALLGRLYGGLTAEQTAEKAACANHHDLETSLSRVLREDLPLP